MITTQVATQPFVEAVARCRQQQQIWAGLPVHQRLWPVRTLRRLLVRDCDVLAEAVARDLGKPADETVAGEVLPLASACRFLQREAGRLLRPRRISLGQTPLWLAGQSDTVYRRPRGLVGIIGTWNYPLLLNGVQILQALTAGNGVLWKPSEVAPSSAATLFDLLAQAGFPDGLVQMLPATREAGPELAQADIDHVVFTGSSATGRRLAETLAGRLISSTMELSGCDPLFVLDDADVQLAARAAWFGCTLNRGQTCIAPRRALVQRSQYAAFCEALRSMAASASPVHLALSSQARQAENLIQDAVQHGAQLLPPSAEACNGHAAPDACTPAVVIDAQPGMAICQEASFAPILAVLPFDTLDDALGMEAECKYALGASIFTRTPEKAVQLAARLRNGSVAVNDVVVSTAHPATPFGGCGDSGWGVTQGAEGLLEMTVPQVVSIRRGRSRPHYVPVGEPGAFPGDMLRGMLKLCHGSSLGQRLAGLSQLLRGWWKWR